MGEGINRPQGSAELASAQDTPMDLLDTTPVEIGEETFHVGELSLDQVIAIARLVAEATLAMDTSQRNALKRAAGAPDANLAGTLQLLDPATIHRLFGIVLDRDGEWIRQHLKLKASLKVIAAIVRHNDPEELKSTFLEATRPFANSLGSWLRGLQLSQPTASPNAKRAGTGRAGSRR